MVEVRSRIPRSILVMRHRDFALVQVGNGVSQVGTWGQYVALGWAIRELSSWPFAVALSLVAQFLPFLLLAPLGGALADRVSRRAVVVVGNVLAVPPSLALGVLVATGNQTIPLLLLLAAVGGVATALSQPAMSAVVGEIVPVAELPEAVASVSVMTNLTRIAGPSLAALVISGWGLQWAFYLNAVSFLAVVIALFLMKGVPERSGGPRRNRGLFDDLAEGLRYAGKTRLVLTLLLMAAITSVFGRSYQQLLPVFAREVLDRGATGLGLMMSAPGAGTLVGAMLLGALGDVRRKGVVFFAGIFTLSVLLIGFTLSRSFTLTIAILFLVGVVSITFSTMMSTMLQLTAPAQMRGRVMSLATVTMQGFAPVGALLTGALAVAIGTPRAVALAAVVVLVAAILAAVRAPDVRDFGAADQET
jgi:MFS family permease